MPKPNFPPPCFAFLHSEMIEAKDGKAEVLFYPTQEMENPFGTIQGGILAAMLDNIIGPAVVSLGDNRQTATIQMSVNYTGAVKAGEKILGIAKVTHAGRLQTVISAHLERYEDGKKLANASAINVFLDS